MLLKKSTRSLLTAGAIALIAAFAAGCSGSSGTAQTTAAPAQTQAEAETQAEETQAEETEAPETEAAVAEETEAPEELSGREPVNGSTYKVGIIQMIENGAFNDMREGFVAQLRDKGYGEDILTIDYKCAQGDATNLQTIAQGMADGSYDLVATIATPPTQAMVNLETETPVFFVSVSAPQAAGVITDMATPDKNATGTSNAIPIEDIFALSDSLTPDAKSFGFLYCTSEINSVTTIEAAKEYCDANGIEYKESIVTNSSEVQQAAQSLVDSVDAIFIPNDSVIQAAMPLVSEVARDAKVPVYGSSATMVDSGAFATVAITDTEIGAQSADMAIQYLTGTDITEIPSIVVPANATVINKITMDALGITIDEAEGIIFVEDAQ